MNAEWHRLNRLPPKAIREQRIAGTSDMRRNADAAASLKAFETTFRSC
jgi:hypothetical protein